MDEYYYQIFIKTHLQLIYLTAILIWNKPKRRDKLVIMAEIIGICRIGSTKTNMMAKGNLSFSQLNQFLFVLSQSGLIEKSAWDGRIVYRATPKGLEFMKKQQQIIELLNENAQTAIINACLW